MRRGAIGLTIGGLQLRELEWDTRFFGQKMGRIMIDPAPEPADFSENAWRRIFEVASRQKYEFLLCEAEATQAQIIQTLSTMGGSLADVLLTLSYNLEKDLMQQRLDSPAVPASEADLPGIIAIAGDSFRQSRFFRDRRFDPGKAGQLYPEWVRNAFQTTEDFYVIKQQEAVAAFISLQKQEELLSIRLLAVEPDCRGMGLGEKLVDWAIDYAAANRLRRITVGTQVSNYPALRLYEKMGFRVERALYRFHFWLASPSQLGMGGLG
ncbi:ribosomal protein S18 acetylase RimI-like enzyme [Hydrogenispora ethanolica]|uniref:Ribosomal protein S18 acetylase RimI-like enzyme n=1 Tax=Hydrogenispora ethanolica TaxID=1082276 RepID=A0A4R1R846_HYDET|nr:ribosomal protein S18 acetylase RimI-like enzyme [Hydrogenispora ethanolica]